MSELTPTAEPPASPRWNTATKFLVALVALVIIGSLLERFQEMLGPLVFAFISYAGIVGLLLAAPLIATLRLFGRYVYRKMFDLDPWPELLTQSPLPPRETWFWLRWFNRLRRRTTDT
jgi:hypothetical protein